MLECHESSALLVFLSHIIIDIGNLGATLVAVNYFHLSTPQWEVTITHKQMQYWDMQDYFHNTDCDELFFIWFSQNWLCYRCHTFLHIPDILNANISALLVLWLSNCCKLQHSHGKNVNLCLDKYNYEVTDYFEVGYYNLKSGNSKIYVQWLQIYSGVLIKVRCCYIKL